MSIQRMALAAVIGSVLWASPASAVEAEIYGRLYPFFVYERGSGATAAGTTVSTLAATPTGTEGLLKDNTGMSAGNSRVGIRGSEVLNDNLKAIFQVETVVTLDTGGWGKPRDTFVGVDGNIGTVKLGFHNTILKDYGDTIGTLGMSSGTFMSTSDIFRKSGFGTKSASSFHLRVPNMVMYESPVFRGLQAGVQYSMYEQKTSTRNPRVLSTGVKYDQGPLYLAVAFEVHYDILGGSQNVGGGLSSKNDPLVNSTDRALQGTVEYRLGKQHRLEADVIWKEYKENATVAGRFRSYENMAFLVAMENRWGEHWRTAVHYVYGASGSCTLVGVPCSTDGLAANVVAAAVGYYFTKNTWAWAAGSLMTNGESARYSNVELGGDPSPGEDITIAAVGILHKF